MHNITFPFHFWLTIEVFPENVSVEEWKIVEVIATPTRNCKNYVDDVVCPGNEAYKAGNDEYNTWDSFNGYDLHNNAGHKEGWKQTG